MNFIEYIKRLRTKSEEEKKRFLIISTSIILILIIALWLAYGINLIPKEAKQSIIIEREKKENIFSSFFHEAGRDLAKVKKDVSNVLENFFEGKYDSKEIPADLKDTTIKTPENSSLILPQTK